MRHVALELHAHGEADAAQRLFARSLGWFLDPPADVTPTPAFRRALAEALHLAREHDRALTVLTALAEDWPDDIALQGRLGTNAALRGDRPEAERISAWLEALDRPYMLGANTLWRARIAALLGDTDRAVDLVSDAFAQGRTDWIALHTDPDLASLRRNRRFRELIRAKG